MSPVVIGTLLTTYLISLAKAGGVITVIETEVAAISSANPAEKRYFLIESIPNFHPASGRLSSTL